VGDRAAARQDFTGSAAPMADADASRVGAPMFGLTLLPTFMSLPVPTITPIAITIETVLRSKRVHRASPDFGRTY